MTKRLTPSEKATRKRERELSKLLRMFNVVEAGGCDELFVDAEAKAAFLADLNTECVALVNAEVDANPDIYQRNPNDGTISLRSCTVVPLRPQTP